MRLLFTPRAKSHDIFSVNTHLARTTSRPEGLMDMEPTLSSTRSDSGLPNVGELNTDRGWPSFDCIAERSNGRMW